MEKVKIRKAFRDANELARENFSRELALLRKHQEEQRGETLPEFTFERNNLIGLEFRKSLVDVLSKYRENLISNRTLLKHQEKITESDVKSELQGLGFAVFRS